MLAGLSANTCYRRIKNFARRNLGVKWAGRFEKCRDFLKMILKPHNLFDQVGINYWGPFDGHDIKNAEKVLELAKNYYRPVLLHFNTVKGKGLPEAEENPTKYHQLAPINTKKSRTWSEAASTIIENFAEEDKRIVCFTAAMITGVKLEKFAEKFPERFFDVGITESHMLTMAAGLAAGGMRPYVFVYSTFLQRAMDQLMHDIALQNLPVVLMIDRAGLAGSDGDTHQGLLDISWGRAIPNLEIFAPSDENSLKDAMLHASKRNAPTLIRYPRGAIPEKNFETLEIKNGIAKLFDGNKIALLGYGASVDTMLKTRELAIEKPAVYDVRRIKPLDIETLDEILKRYEIVCTVEESYIAGGLGEAVSSRAAEKNFNVKVLKFGVPDVCVKHATQSEQRELYGLTPENILEKCRNEN